MRRVVLNRAPGELTLSTRAYERLIELGVPVVDFESASQREPEDLFLVDCAQMPGMVISDNPADAETADAWQHSDFRYQCFAMSFLPARMDERVLRVVDELQSAAGAPGCRIGVILVPDDVNPAQMILTRDGAGWEVVAWPTTSD